MRNIRLVLMFKFRMVQLKVRRYHLTINLPSFKFRMVQLKGC